MNSALLWNTLPMPVCSYIIHPKPGSLSVLTEQLNAIKGCEATPADNRDLLILVTETADQAEERRLMEHVKQVEAIQNITQTFGQIETDPQEENTHD
jgi:nitrate reductase NapAB chaperone NapD